MNKDKQQIVRFAYIQAWGMSLICSLLALFAAAAATRIPHYLAVSDYIRLVGVILFGLIVLAGVIANIHTHVCLWRSRNDGLEHVSRVAELS